MINMIMSSIMTNSDTAVRRLALEHPEWLPVLQAAVAVAERVEEHGGEFAGSWVLTELASRSGRRWVPNLRILVTYGLLEKSGESTRGGRRAYYRMPDRAGVSRSLESWVSAARTKRTPSFIAAGVSTDSPNDIGRRADESPFTPRSWR
jgi:hypothetical protein